MRLEFRRWQKSRFCLSVPVLAATRLNFSRQSRNWRTAAAGRAAAAGAMVDAVACLGKPAAGAGGAADQEPLGAPDSNPAVNLIVAARDLHGWRRRARLWKTHHRPIWAAEPLPFPPRLRLPRLPARPAPAHRGNLQVILRPALSARGPFFGLAGRFWGWYLGQQGRQRR